MEANTWIKQIQYDREKDKPSTLVTTDGWSYTEDSEAGKRAILEQNHRVTLTTNGVHSVNPESGFEGMKKATVTVDVPPMRLGTRRVTITKNNTSTLVEPELGYDGLASVDCEVEIPTESRDFHFLREDFSDTPQGFWKAETNIEPVPDSLLSKVKVTSTLMDTQETITQNGSITFINVPNTLPTSVIGFHTVEVTVEVPTTLYAWFPLDGTVSRPAYTTSLPDTGHTNVSFLIAGTTTGSRMSRYDTAAVNASGNLEFTLDGTAYEYTRTGHGTTYDITVPYNR